MFLVLFICCGPWEVEPQLTDLKFVIIIHLLRLCHEEVVEVAVGVDSGGAGVDFLDLPWASHSQIFSHYLEKRILCTQYDSVSFESVQTNQLQPMDPLPVLSEYSNDEKQICNLQIGFATRLRKSQYYVIGTTKSSGAQYPPSSVNND